MFTKKKKEQLRQAVQNLTAKDFVVKTKSVTGEVIVGNDSDIFPMFRVHTTPADSIKRITGEQVQRVSFPVDTLKTGEDTNLYYKSKVIGCISSFKKEISKDIYEDYCEKIEGVGKVETETFVLFATLSEENPNYQLFSKYREENQFFPLDFIAQRYNVLNLITDNIPFSENDFDNFLVEIKKHMMEYL